MTREEMARFLYETFKAQAESSYGDETIMVPEGPISRKIAWDCVTVRGTFDFLAIAEAILTENRKREP